MSDPEQVRYEIYAMADGVRVVLHGGWPEHIFDLKTAKRRLRQELTDMALMLELYGESNVSSVGLDAVADGPLPVRTAL
jgi:hypothetical protein